jgi:hypothetical protein
MGLLDPYIYPAIDRVAAGLGSGDLTFFRCNRYCSYLKIGETSRQ